MQRLLPGPYPRIVAFILIFAAFTSGGVEGADLPAQGLPEMVVVAPERFHQALARFIAYRSEQRPTKLASLEAILKETSTATRR